MIKSVVIIEPVGGEGGMSFHNHQLSQSIGKLGWKVILCSSNSKAYSSEHYQSRDFFNDVFGSSPLIIRGIKYFIAIVRIVYLICLEKTSIVHFHFYRIGLKEAVMVGLVNLLCRNIVITAHDIGSLRNGDDFQYGFKYVYKKASTIISHSKSSFKALTDLNFSLDRKISLIPLGGYINYLPSPKKDTLKELIKQNNADVRIIFFGKLKRIKRVDLAIEAVGILKRKGISSVKLIIAGKPYDISEYEINNAILDQGVQDSVTFISRYISDDELSSLLAWANISVLPYDKIFQSGVLLLCMSNRLPVIVSNIPGMMEIVSDGLNGATFEADNVFDLAQTLEKLLNNSGHLKNLAINAYDFVERNHGWDLCGKLTVEAYSRTLKETSEHHR